VVNPAGAFASVGTGWESTCAIRDDQTLVCWGKPDWGIALTPEGRFDKLAVGARHACAIGAEDGAVACWGAGGPDDPNFEEPNNGYYGQAMPPSGRFVDLSAGEGHTCGIRPTGKLECWGAGTDDGACAEAFECGQAMPPSGAFVDVAAGSSNSCAIRDDGVFLCWGSNTGDRSTPPQDLRAF
jgi:alpha-tubulin suppressor-like RCC1 family protein